MDIGFLRFRDVAQPGSAPAWGVGGRRFKSARPDHFYLETHKTRPWPGGRCAMREMSPVCQIDRLDCVPAQGGERSVFPITTHLLVEIWEAPFKALARVKEVEGALRFAGNGAGQRGEVMSYQFEPYGVSAKATFPGAHIFIHTWPENGYAAVDIMAGSQEEAYQILERLKEAFQPRYMHVVEVRRGNLGSEGNT